MFCIPKYYHDKKLDKHPEQYKTENIVFKERMKFSLCSLSGIWPPGARIKEIACNKN